MRDTHSRINTLRDVNALGWIAVTVALIAIPLSFGFEGGIALSSLALIIAGVTVLSGELRFAIATTTLVSANLVMSL